MGVPIKTEVLSQGISLREYEKATHVLSEFGQNKPDCAIFCNVHMIMLAQEDKALANAISEADYVFADGVPVAWLQARLHRRPARAFRGYEAMLYLCERACSAGHKVGLFGSTEKVLAGLRQNLVQKFPALQISYAAAPAYVEGELKSPDSEIAAINAAGLRYLFVGLGCPKQEKWMQCHASQLNCSLLGVGAAFDWLAGTTPKPPAWMEQAGLGWLFRLALNPRRLWRRYLVYNSKFILAALKALYFNRRAAPGAGRKL